MNRRMRILLAQFSVSAVAVFCILRAAFSGLDTNPPLPYVLPLSSGSQKLPQLPKISAPEVPVPLNLVTLSLVASPVSGQEGLKILERDDYRCQYCGLDGRASFENALVMRVDFVHPRARKGKKDPSNLVACCAPCNTIKGTKVYANFDEAKSFVLKQREGLRKVWQSKAAHQSSKPAGA